MEIDKEDVFQAIVLMDTFNGNLSPIVKYKPLALLSVAGVPLIEYALQSLAVGGITEAILFCCQDPHVIKDYLKNNDGLWKCTMDVQVKSSDTCQSIGDVMREIDAASLVKGDFILLGINTITNIDFASLLEQHKQTVKKDKGAAMTLVYKQLSQEHTLIKSDKSMFLAADGKTRKVLVHQKFKPKSDEKAIAIPTKHILSNSEVKLHHDLVDPNIAVCSPSVPPLFADNFDFQTRDDFIHGLLIQEDILADSLYYTILKSNKYAAAVTNWKTYQTVCRNILHNWTYPLSIESGTYKELVYLGKHIYRNKTAKLHRSCRLVEDVLVGSDSYLGDNTIVYKSFIGNNVTIGNNVLIEKSYIMDKTIIDDNVVIINSFIDEECCIREQCTIKDTLVAQKLKVQHGVKLNSTILEKLDSAKEKKIKTTSESGTEWENESVGSGEDEFIGMDKEWSESESCYSSDSSEDTSIAGLSIPDDTNIFLNEVIDSLTRGFEDKLKCDYLILEINSSRYAYNIQLHEVNFYVVRAMLSLPQLIQANNFLLTLRDIIKYFLPVFGNYIKSKSSIMDCLRAVEETCVQAEWLKGNSGHVIHMLYDAEVVDEDSLLEFYADMKKNNRPLLQYNSVVKFFEWLEQADEESDESD